jgi:cytochrome c556
MRGVSVVIAAGLLLGLAACEPAPKTPGAIAARARHENMEKLGRAFKALGDEVKKSAPDAAKLTALAAQIDESAQVLSSWFPAGSGPQDGVKTHAKPEVWTRAGDFADAVARLKNETRELRANAPNGAPAIAANVKDVGEACGECHRTFRAKTT